MCSLKIYHCKIASLIAVLVLLCVLPSVGKGQKPAIEKANAKKQLNRADADAVRAFREQAKQYVKLRERVTSQLPKLSSESKPAEIEAYKKAFDDALRKERAAAQPGDIFTPEIARYIKGIIQEEFKGKRLNELKEKVATANVKGVPLRINYPYPEVKELIEMPPTLLLLLPELPKELRYYFVGRNLLLIDKDARLIIDYLPEVLP